MKKNLLLLLFFVLAFGKVFSQYTGTQAKVALVGGNQNFRPAIDITGSTEFVLTGPPTPPVFQLDIDPTASQLIFIITGGSTTLPANFGLDIVFSGGNFGQVTSVTKNAGATTSAASGNLTAVVQNSTTIRITNANSVLSSSNSGVIVWDISATVAGVTTPSAPAQPTASSVTATGFTVNWGAVTDATSYRLDVASDADFNTIISSYNDLTVSGASQEVTGLTSGTTYYFRVRAVNALGTSASSTAASQATTLATPVINSSGTLSAVNTTYGSASATPTSFTVSGSNLTTDITVTPPTGFEVSTSSGTGYGATVILTPSSGTVGTTTVYVRLKASATVSGSPYSGNVVVSSTGATSKNIATVSSSVSAKSITITGISISNKLYNGNATATISGTAALSGVEAGDAVNVVLGGAPSATFTTPGAGTSKAVTVTGYTLGGSAAGNYSLTQPTGLAASIFAKPIAITGISISSKEYNGDATATISGTASLSGVLPGDAGNVSLGGTPSAAFTTTAVGTNKAVTVSGYSISGSASGNYSLLHPGLTANITAKPIAITGISISNREYNGSTTATISGTAALSGVEAGDAANVTLDGTPAATFATAGLGTGKGVTVSGYSISGSASGNYSLTQPTGLTADITAKTITITGLSINNKQYNGTATATISGTVALSGVEAGDAGNVIVGGAPSATFTTAGAGTSKAVTVSGYTLGGSAAGNYSLTQPAGLTGNITPRALSISGISISNKQYDGSTTATISGTASLIVVLSVDAGNVTLGGTPSAAFTTAAVGTNKAVTVSGYSISGSASGNYSLTQPASLTANITAKPIAITGISISNREYNGSTTATISGTAALSGVEAGDAGNVTLGGTPVATFATSGLGTGKGVTVSGYSISGSASGNYSLTQPTGLTADITAKTITITGISISNKQYDGTTTASISGAAALSGVEAGDAADVTLEGTPSAAFTTAAVGTNKAVTVSGYSISGSASGNYSLDQPTGLTADITAKSITITGISINNKEYNGNATATISGTAALSGVEAGDAANVTLGGTPTATFATATVGMNKAVTISGYGISGSASGNYSLSQPTGLTADIIAKPIAITGISISNKQYDGTTTATISGTAALSGVEAGDAANVTLEGTSAATFATTGLGTGKAVAVSGYSISGSASGNYSLTQPIGLTADITARILTASAQPVSKIYDGNTTATVNFDTFDVASGLIGDENVSIIYTSAAYDTKNVGSGNAITISGLALSGTDKDNYSLNVFNTTGEITAKSLIAGVIGTVSKVYDGTVAATLAPVNYSLSGVLAGETVVLNNPTGGSYDTRNIGTGKTVTVNGLSISGANAANYSLASTSISGSVGTITPKSLTAGLTGTVSKIYDGTTAAGLNTANYTLSGVLPGETVVLNNPTSGSYDNSNAGAGKIVTVNGLSISGIDVASYSLVSTSINGTVGTITAKALTITADNKEKVQGLAMPTFTATYSGFVNGETSGVLTAQPNFSTTANTMSPQGTYPITVTGATAANYAITHVNGLLTVKVGYPTSITLARATVYENTPVGTLAAILSSTSDDPTATFTYSLVSGSGSTDNSLFTISGNEIKTAASLNFEQKSSYAVRIRATTQHNLSLDQEFIITISDVNEQPTIANITDQTICYTTFRQTVNLTGITAGPDAGQSISTAVTSTNNALFSALEVRPASGGDAELRYTIANGVSGTAVITIRVQDDGGTANGGTDMILKSFTLTVNPLPVVNIVSDLGTDISKGATAKLTASGGSSYSWTNASGMISGQNTATLTVRPAQTTTYRVTVSNASGCISEQEITLVVKEDYETVKATNIMSPNGDGVNDLWVIENIDMYPNNEVSVFDKAGRLLFGQKNYQNTWDATINGMPLAEGTYYYVVDFGRDKEKKKGFITVVRNL